MRFETIEQISSDLKLGKTSSLTITNDVIEAIESIDPVINAYSYRLIEIARIEAAASDQRRAKNGTLGPIDGIPIAIKDLIDTVPAKCSAGLIHLRGYAPKRDAEVVRRLREAGAVLVGVTETDAGAFLTDTPKVQNPISPDRSVGGSSGGSAAAVAAGLAYAALGTDTGGSIRIPSACCSICGFKPSWGRVSTRGVRPLVPSFDHVGPMARCVTDLALVQSILDPDFMQAPLTRVDQPLRLGIPNSIDICDKQNIDELFAQVLETLSQNGVAFQKIELPDLDDVARGHLTISAKEASDYHIKMFPDEWQDYPEVARETIEFGQRVSTYEYEKATISRNAMRCQVSKAFDELDAILMPVMPINTPLRGDWSYTLGSTQLSKLQATIRFTSLFNDTGHPVVSMPAAIQEDSEVFSVQIIGRESADRNLLEIASRIERILGLNLHYGKLNAPFPLHPRATVQSS